MIFIILFKKITFKSINEFEVAIQFADCLEPNTDSDIKISNNLEKSNTQ